VKRNKEGARKEEQKARKREKLREANQALITLYTHTHTPHFLSSSTTSATNCLAANKVLQVCCALVLGGQKVIPRRRKKLVFEIRKSRERKRESKGEQYKGSTWPNY